eukprot:scaffold111234_cov26-Tisochrysis_lutea.AAC.1
MKNPVRWQSEQRKEAPSPTKRAGDPLCRLLAKVNQLHLLVPERGLAQLPLALEAKRERLGFGRRRDHDDATRLATRRERGEEGRLPLREELASCARDHQPAIALEALSTDKSRA